MVISTVIDVKGARPAYAAPFRAVSSSRPRPHVVRTDKERMEMRGQSAARPSHALSHGDLDAALAALASANADIDRLNSEMDALSKELADTRAELAEAKSKLQKGDALEDRPKKKKKPYKPEAVAPVEPVEPVEPDSGSCAPEPPEK